MLRKTLLLLLLASAVLLTVVRDARASPGTTERVSVASVAAIPFPCVAFSPYVDNLNPNTGPHPTPALIDTLLNTLVNQTPFRCIMTYGVLNGLDYTFVAAEARGIKAVAIIWLDSDDTVNAASVAAAIAAATSFPDTITGIACGSEVRLRLGEATATSKIRSCIDSLRAASLSQPIGSNDIWWNWCDETSPCQQWDLADDVDWIGINVFPWWENKFSGLYPCTTASDAAEFNIARLNDIRGRYPGKEVILTEFGWPAGPNGYTETNQYTGQQCGIASEANQALAVEETIDQLDTLGLRGVVFGAFREAWKTDEGPVGPYWGLCQGTAPYTCKSLNTALWDSDLDGVANSVDPCPNNPDCDNDSSGKVLVQVTGACPTGGVLQPAFRDCIELFMGTDPLDACALTTTANDENPDPWPPDANDDQDADVGDVVWLFGDPDKDGVPIILNPSEYDQRSDFDGDGNIDVGDVLTGFAHTILTRCA